jgi:hypothetical protein
MAVTTSAWTDLVARTVAETPDKQARALERSGEVLLLASAYTGEPTGSRMLRSGWFAAHERRPALVYDLWRYEGSDYSVEIEEFGMSRSTHHGYKWTVMLHEPRPSGNLFCAYARVESLSGAVTAVSQTLANNI